MMQYVKDLTHGSIRGQLVRLALPVMGSSFVQMAYSFTDMAWVGSLQIGRGDWGCRGADVDE